MWDTKCFPRSHPQIPIQAAVLDGLGDVARLDAFLGFDICDHAGDLDDPIVGTPVPHMKCGKFRSYCYIHLKQNISISSIISITAPNPILRFRYQTAFDRIIVTVIDFLLNRFRIPAIMIITSSLPENKVIYFISSHIKRSIIGELELRINS